MRRSRNRARMKKAIEKGVFFLLHLAPPCSTWSRARLPALRRPGFFIRGLPGLTPSAKAKADEGTELAVAT
eukprot:11501388-Alexandrium_andersonii.AAC.1